MKFVKKYMFDKEFQILYYLVIIIIIVIIYGEDEITTGTPQNSVTDDDIDSTEAHLFNTTFEIFEQHEIHNNNNTMLRDIIETQKLDILKRLGFKDQPHASKNNLSIDQLRETLWHFRQSEELIRDDVSNSLLFGDDDNMLAVQFYSFNDNGYRPPSMNSTNIDKFVYFEINIYKPHEEQTMVESAILKLYKSYVKPELIISSDFVDKSVSIKINQIINDSVGYSRKTIASRLVSLENIGWEEFDVSRSVQEWLHDSSTNYGLEIVCDERHEMDDLIHFVTWNETRDRISQDGDDANSTQEIQTYWPTLNIITRSFELPSAEDRRKRSTDEIQSNLVGDCGQLECCSHPYEISFDEIGWNWVIQPKNIVISVCSGSCPQHHQQCIVSKYEMLTMVHFDENLNVLLSLLPNIIPVECKCDVV